MGKGDINGQSGHEINKTREEDGVTIGG